MDLEKIHEFAVFAQSLKFTEAAQELHMSQSSLSKHMRDLEGELGVLLVERGATGTGKNTLTPGGRRFLELVRGWLDEYDAIVAECREIQNTLPPARIQDMHCSFNINSQLRRALEAHGATSGNFAYVDTPLPLRSALDQGVLDFAVFAEPTSQMDAFRSEDLAGTYGWLPLTPEPLCFLTGLGNPLAQNPTISLADIERSQIITIENSAHSNWQNATSAIFEDHGCTLNFKLMHDSPPGRRGLSHRPPQHRALHAALCPLLPGPRRRGRSAPAGRGIRADDLPVPGVSARHRVGHGAQDRGGVRGGGVDGHPRLSPWTTCSPGCAVYVR